MRRTAALLPTFCLAFGCLLAGGAPAAHALEAKTYDYAGGGRWPVVDRPQTQAIVDPELDHAEQLLANKQAKDARKILAAWVKSPAHRKAPDRDRALYLLAEADYQQDEWIKAFYQLDELLEKYPESRLFYAALEKQYQIADRFLKGHLRKLLGIPLLSAEDEAIDMLFRIQERSPGSPLAERALLRSADHYFNTSQFDLAADAYAAYVRSYPRSPDVPRVRLRQAFSSYAQFRGVRFDATPLIDARAQFEDIKIRYPDMAAEANAQRFIDAINDTLARKLLSTAEFYRRTDKPAAAAYTYRQLTNTYPDSKEAQAAKKELQRLPAWAQQERTTPGTRPAEPPTTSPSRSSAVPSARQPAPQPGSGQDSIHHNGP